MEPWLELLRRSSLECLLLPIMSGVFIAADRFYMGRIAIMYGPHSRAMATARISILDHQWQKASGTDYGPTVGGWPCCLDIFLLKLRY